MSAFPFRYLILALLAAAAWWPAHGAAQVRRCTGPDGNAVYTDRPCEYIGAVERVPHAQAGQSMNSRRYGGCARNIRDLVYEITAAFDARDPNRLAGAVHWAGMSTRTAYGLMGRLDALAKRPLIDIVPVYARVYAPEPALAADAAGDVSVPFSLEGHGQDVPGEAVPAPASDPDYYPQQTVRRGPPIALRIEQTLGDGATPSRSVFGLQRHMGCWWIRL
ncbi:MAG TPA: hypothetical protein VJ806_13485 [Luteimonas sp.]|nr:hypothetical protein [Luteimonas sp.]